MVVATCTCMAVTSAQPAATQARPQIPDFLPTTFVRRPSVRLIFPALHARFAASQILPNLSRIHLLRTASQARQQPTNRGPEPSHVGQPKTVTATDAAPTAVQSVGAIAVQLQDGAGAHTGPRPADGGPAGDEGQLGTSSIY